MSAAIQLLNEVRQALETFPNDVELVPAVPALVAAGIGAAAMRGAQRAIFWRASEKRSQQYSDPNMLVAIKHNAKADRNYSLRPTVLMSTGIFAVAGVLGADMNRITTAPESNSDTYVVSPQSYSMRDTADLTDRPATTRLEAVNQGILGAKYDGRLGIIQPEDAPNSPITSLHLTTKWHNKKAIQTPVADPNSVSLAPAVDLATTLLESTGNNKTNRNIVIPTDGIISDQDKLKQSVANATAKHIKVSFVVPGTPAGTYKYRKDAPATPSAAKPENLTGIVPQSRIIETQTAKDTVKAVESQITAAGSKDVQNPADMLALAGGATFLAGFGTAMKRAMFRNGMRRPRRKQSKNKDEE